MKVNELQIGDYVNYRGQIIKVTSLYDKGGSNEVSWSDKESVWVNGRCIEPIPLTPEILEKNRFKFQSACICDNKDAWIWEWPSDKEYELPHCFMLMSHHNKKKYPYFWIYAPNNPDIKYVHELQHALRLCKIKKEIIL